MPEDFEEQGFVKLSVAASLARDFASEGKEFLASLVDLLLKVMPERTEKVVRGGLFSRKEVVGVAVDIGDYRYRMAHDHRGGFEASRTHTVRGIALKTEPIPVDQWISEVGDGVQQFAESNAKARKALAEFSGE